LAAVNAMLLRLLQVSADDGVETKDLQSRQKGVNVVSSVDQEGDGNDISGDVGRRLEGGSVVTVSTGKVSDRKSRSLVG